MTSTNETDNRIVGGEDAIEGQFPYQILLRFNPRRLCGASLISLNNKHVVLTAAHCVVGYKAENVAAVAGKLRRSTNSTNEQSRQVRKILVHHRYNPESENTLFDIAMLGLVKNFRTTSYVQPIPLPEWMQDTSGFVIASGWGTTKEGGNASDILKWVKMPIVSNPDCVVSYDSGRVPPSTLCAGLEEGGKDTCQGDSGGPLMATRGNYLTGITSNGDVS